MIPNNTVLNIKTGIDIIEISRVARLAKKPRFITKCFSADEIRFFITRGFNASTIAGNFCVKEAFAKTMGTGFRGFSMSDISVLRDSLNSPYIMLEGNAKKIAEREKLSFSVSISHCKDYATAVVVAYRKI